MSKYEDTLIPNRQRQAKAPWDDEQKMEIIIKEEKEKELIFYLLLV